MTVPRSGSLATRADLENATPAWVHWYNTTRLMHRLGRRPPAEAEAAYRTAQATVTPIGDSHDHPQPRAAQRR